MGDRRRRLVRGLGVVVVALGLAVAAGGWPAWAQLPTSPSQLPDDPTTTTTAPPPGSSTTTTTLPLAPPPSSDTTSPPPGAPPPSEPPPPQPGDPAAGADGGDGGDGGLGQVVPPDAQAIINSVPRTAPNDTLALMEGVRTLEAMGVPSDEAINAVFGRYPIAGVARWSDDWLFPRWTGALFRFHLGLDMFADHGTPVRAPVDGVARISTSPLGGLAVKVFEPDGTYYYMAHLGGVADGLVDGAPVVTGDIVGFVGDSGNARGGAPHLHIGIHPGGGAPAPPKPVMDQFVADALANMPEVIAAYRAAQPRALVASNLIRELSDGVPRGAVALPAGPRSTELLFASSANPTGGGLALAEASATATAESVDWALLAIEQEAFAAAWNQSASRARAVLAPLIPQPLRDAAAARAGGPATTLAGAPPGPFGPSP